MRAVLLALWIAFVGIAAGCGMKPDATGGEKGGTPDHTPIEVSKSDADRIQGVWMVEVYDLGKELPPTVKETMKTARFQFDGDKLTKRDRPDRAGFTSSFKLDSTKNPRTIDLSDDSETFPGIYKFETDGTLVLTVSGGDKRPSEFKAIQPDPKVKGSPSAWLVRLKKVDEKPTVPPPPRTSPTKFEGKIYKAGEK